MGFVVSSTLENTSRAHRKERAIMPRAAQKIIRQPTVSTRMPAMVGATTGAAPTDSPYQPMAEPRFFEGKMVKIMTWAMEERMPFPTA